MSNTYTINEEFFSKWSPEMAYVLGFIYADGNMSRNRYAVRIHSKDYQILDDIRKVMDSNLPVKKKEKGPFVWYELFISRKRIYSDLRKLGIFPDKSLTMRFPEIQENMTSHFIRGYFDGDGCIYKVTRKDCEIPGLEIDFATGSKNFANSVFQFLTDNVHPTFKLYNKRKNYYCIRGWNQASEAIFNFMYNSASIYIKRKYNKFISIINQRHSNLG